MTPSRALGLTLLAVFALPCAASADVPPPPGFVETCTVATQQELGGGPCESVATLHGGVAPVDEAPLRARGLTMRCTGGGATVGVAVYCAGVATSAPPASRSGVCAVSA